MVIGDTFVYSGKGFSYTAIKTIRDGGIIDIGYSSWERNEQWLEVLEDNFFIGFISSQTKLIDLDNYFYVMQENLFCYEKPDPSSEIKIRLTRHDKIYLVSKLFSKGMLWLKIYDKHGFCCYIDANSYIFPRNSTPYWTVLNESTIMYIPSPKKDFYKTSRLKKGSRIYVNRLVAYKFSSGLDTSYDHLIDQDIPILLCNSKNSIQLFNDTEIDYLLENNFIEHISSVDDIWMQIFARGQIGYIPAITKTNIIPYIEHLPNEHFMPKTDYPVYKKYNKLSITGLIALVIGLAVLSIFPAFSVFAFYFCILGVCLFVLKYFCS